MNKIFCTVKIKESKGEFSPAIDIFKGSPETVAKILLTKYANTNKHKKVKFLDWLYEPFKLFDEDLKKP